MSMMGRFSFAVSNANALLELTASNSLSRMEELSILIQRKETEVNVSSQLSRKFFAI
jgi:hypothetical protein